MDEKNDALQNSQTPGVPLSQEPAPPTDPLPEMTIPSVRTYKGDVNHTVNQDKITTAKVLMAEERKREKANIHATDTSVKRPTNILALVFGILFIVAGVGAVGYFGYIKIINTSPSIALPSQTFFLFAFDKEEYIDTSGTRTNVFAAVETAKQKAFSAPANSYTELVYIKMDSQLKQNVRLTSGELFNLYEVRLPVVLGRSLAKDFVYGLYRGSAGVEPFIVLSLADAEAGYTSMFEWEQTLALDLQDFFPVLKDLFAVQNVPQEQVDTEDVPSDLAEDDAPISSDDEAPVEDEVPVEEELTDDARAIEPPAQPLDRTVRFTDVVLSNRDTRAIRDANGTPFFFYTFIERDKILFAQDPQIISEIIRKIREKQLVR